MPRTKSFREAGSRIFQQEAETGDGIIQLLAARSPTAVRDIPVDKIVPNPTQPRMTWHQETLKELAASIGEHGVLQPILVRPAGDGFEIIAGERRWRAFIKGVVDGKLTLLKLHDRVAKILDPNAIVAREEKEDDTPALRDDALITATRRLNEALMELSEAVGAADVPDGDRQNLAKFLTISRARLDNLVARIRSATV